MYKILIFLLLSTVAYAQNVTRMATASGTNSYTCTFNPAITSLNSSTVYVITFTNANTSTAVTLDPAGAVAATDINDNSGNDLAISAIKAGGTYALRYNGTNFRVMGSLSDQQSNTITWFTKTSNYTPIATDTLYNDPGFMMRSASATSFTVPPSTTTDFNTGTSFLIYNDSTGTVSILEGAGVAFESTATGPWTLAEDEYAVVTKSNETNTWKLMVGNPGGGMSNPMTTAGDIIYGGASGTPTRLALGTALHHLRVNAAGTGIEWAADAGGGVSNGAANTELTMSDGTDLDPSGIFIPSAGSINLGTGLTGTNRTITSAGSGSNLDLTFTTKGTSSFFFTQAINAYYPSVNNFHIQGTSTPTLWVGGDGGTVGYVKGGTGTSGQNNGADLEVIAGLAYQASGNGSGGDIAFSPGARRSAGSGTDGRVVFNALAGWTEWVNGNTTPSALVNTIATYVQDVNASSELKVMNEAGVVSQLTEQSQTLTTETTTVGNVTTGEDQLFSYTVAAGRLRVNGQSIRARFSGTLEANGNTKTIKVKFGSTNMVNVFGTFTSVWTIDCEIIRTGAATQKCNCTTVGASSGLTHSSVITATETLSGTVAIVLTGEGTATNDLVKETGKIIFVP